MDLGKFYEHEEIYSPFSFISFKHKCIRWMLSRLPIPQLFATDKSVDVEYTEPSIKGQQGIVKTSDISLPID